MPPEILALITNPHLLIAILAIAILIGLTKDMLVSKRRRQEWRARNAWRWKKRPRNVPLELAQPKHPDAPEQLRIVMEADFEVQPLLNRSEARLFKELDRMVIACNPAWQVMAQVSLGEVLRCADPSAYGCINSKRVDLLLMDGDCYPRHVIEYQGAGHHQGSAAARDAVKKEALRKAGIDYHEIVAGKTTPAELKRLIEKLVDKPK